MENPRKILMLAVLPLALATCSVSTKFVSPVKPPVIAAPDGALMKVCSLPANIGNEASNAEQVEDLWIADRTALLECYRRHLALRNYIVDRDQCRIAPSIWPKTMRAVQKTWLEHCHNTSNCFLVVFKARNR